MSDVSITVSDSTSVDVTVSAATSVDVTTSVATSVDVTEKGPKGDKGEKGDTGDQGAAGQGVPAGGTQFQVLRKIDGEDYNTEWSFADRVTIEVRFDEAVSKGDPLYITGYNNGQNRIAVAKADAADSSKMPSIGLAKDDYSQNDNGQATCIGSLEDIDTQVANDFQEGDVVYVASGGGLTNVKPTGTNLIQNVGKVGRRQQNNGEIVVMAIGRSNDVPNIPDGQIWIGNASGVATPTAFGVDLDSTPQLGGDLDVNGNKITSASNGDITIDPDGTGAIILKSDDIQFDGGGGIGTGKIKLYESDVLGSNFIAISAPISVTSDTTFILPDGPPSVSDYALVSSVTGALSWKTFLDGNTETLLGTTSLKPVGALDAMLAFYDDAGDNYVILRAPDVLTGNTTFFLPASDGSANQVIKTDGSGNLSFVDQPSGTVDTFGTPANTQLAVFTDSDTIKGDSNLEWSGTALELGGALEANSIRTDASVSLSSAGDFSMGSRVLKSFGTNTLSLTAGDVYQYDGGWDAARANTTDGIKMLCVASDTQSRTAMVKEGIVKMADSTGFSSAADGDVLYLDSTAGHVTATAPTGSSAVVRVVGYVYDASAGTIYFDPSKDWIELTA